MPFNIITDPSQSSIRAHKLPWPFSVEIYLSNSSSYSLDYVNNSVPKQSSEKDIGNKPWKNESLSKAR